jgi:hypothetical protein
MIFRHNIIKKVYDLVENENIICRGEDTFYLRRRDREEDTWVDEEEENE